MIHSLTSDLAWADRLYRKASPFPSADPHFAAQEAYNAYQRLELKYGASPRSRLGVARCLMLLGHYSEAAKVFPPIPEAAEARRRAEIALRCSAFTHGRQVLKIERTPGDRNRWIVFIGKRSRSKEYTGGFQYDDLSLWQFAQKGTAVIPIGAEVSVPQDEFTISTSMFVTGSVRNLKAIVICQGLLADCSPSQQRIFAVGRGTFRTIGVFNSIGEVRLLPATATRGFRVMITPTYKVWWSDVYEWDGHRFLFANHHSPGAFHPETLLKSDRTYYPYWLRNASIFAIRGQTAQCLQALKTAERLCRWSIRDARMGVDSVYYGGGFYGNDTDNLREIRQRIRWLRQGDLNHILLYRPYDWDLCVPPYRLGHAGDSR